MGVMVNAPFRKWHHKSDIITTHVNKPSHIAAFQAVEDYIRSIEFPEKTTPVIRDITTAENIVETGTFSNVLRKPSCTVVASALHSEDIMKSWILPEILETFWT